MPVSTRSKRNKTMHLVKRTNNKKRNELDRGSHNAALDWEAQKTIRERNRRAKAEKKRLKQEARRQAKLVKTKGIAAV